MGSSPVSATRPASTQRRTAKFVAEFEAANKSKPDLYGADLWRSVLQGGGEKAKSTDTDKVREAMRGLQWATPQGTKTMRAGDHQAMQDMYAGEGRGRPVPYRRQGGGRRGDRPRRLQPLLRTGAMLDWLQFVLAPQVVNGLSIGVAVVLMALGLTIIFGLLDVINMAHGEFYAIGAYAALG